MDAANNQMFKCRTRPNFGQFSSNTDHGTRFTSDPIRDEDTITVMQSSSLCIVPFFSYWNKNAYMLWCIQRVKSPCIYEQARTGYYRYQSAAYILFEVAFSRHLNLSAASPSSVEYIARSITTRSADPYVVSRPCTIYIQKSSTKETKPYTHYICFNVS